VDIREQHAPQTAALILQRQRIFRQHNGSDEAVGDESYDRAKGGE